MTITVKDASGNNQTINTINPNGLTTAANSQPVVIASDQAPIPVSFSAIDLPTGAASDVTLTALATTNHADIVALTTSVGAAATNNRTDMGTLTTAINTAATASHTDLGTLTTAVSTLKPNVVSTSKSLYTKAGQSLTVAAINTNRKSFEISNPPASSTYASPVTIYLNFTNAACECTRYLTFGASATAFTTDGTTATLTIPYPVIVSAYPFTLFGTLTGSSVSGLNTPTDTIVPFTFTSASSMNYPCTLAAQSATHTNASMTAIGDSIPIYVGQTYCPPASATSTETINIYCANSQPITVKEYQ